MEFAKLLYLLREHGAKATFVVDWHDIRERGLCASVGEMMQLLKHNEHEVAIKFKTEPCNAPTCDSRRSRRCTSCSACTASPSCRPRWSAAYPTAARRFSRWA